MKVNSIIKKITLLLFVLALIMVKPVDVKAAKPTDEIVDYEITVDVADDATLNIVYHIQWLVLESDGIGPVSWVQIGIPNRHYNSMEGLTDNIKSMSFEGGNGSYARIDFYNKYYEGEVIDFAFSINQDNVYEMNTDTGITEYKFTPGWFDEAAVDNLTVRWNSSKVEGINPDGKLTDGYYVWNTSLPMGGKYPVSVTYKNDAFNFHMVEEDNYVEGPLDAIAVFIGIIVIILMMAVPFALPIAIVIMIYKLGRGFLGVDGKQITRTKIEYYSSCQNCGGTRKEGTDECAYCGSNMIKHKEIINEKDLPKEDRDILKYRSNGDYKFSSSPNTYCRVHVVPVPVSRPSSSGRGGSHSSCAHSSCACACACACAGGGRAGCTTKDFYNTNLKLANLVYKKNRRK